jgi:hypothetical protein
MKQRKRNELENEQWNKDDENISVPWWAKIIKIACSHLQLKNMYEVNFYNFVWSFRKLNLHLTRNDAFYQ